MSKLESDLMLPVDSARAVAVSREAVEALGWSVHLDDAELLTAKEDAMRLQCCASPARLEMRFASSDGDQTRLKMLVEVPGYGPIASRDVHRKSRAVALCIARRVTNARPSQP